MYNSHDSSFSYSHCTASNYSMSNIHRQKSDSNSSTDLLALLVELDHESEEAVITISDIIASADGLLHPTSNGSAPKIGPKTLSSLRAMSGALSERLKCLARANGAVRRALVQRLDTEESRQLIVTQRDQLVRKNAELMAMNSRFQRELMERDESICQLHSELHSELCSCVTSTFTWSLSWKPSLPSHSCRAPSMVEHLPDLKPTAISTVQVLARSWRCVEVAFWPSQQAAHEWTL